MRLSPPATNGKVGLVVHEGVATRQDVLDGADFCARQGVVEGRAFGDRRLRGPLFRAAVRSEVGDLAVVVLDDAAVGKRVSRLRRVGITTPGQASEPPAQVPLTRKIRRCRRPPCGTSWSARWRRPDRRPCPGS